MGCRRATYSVIALLCTAYALGGASDARAQCPITDLEINFSQTIEVPAGCTYMRVKAWGNGGNSGFPDLAQGRGGGGGAIKVWFFIQPGMDLWARVVENQTQTSRYGGKAVALHFESWQGPILFLVGGGGGGGTSADLGNGEQFPDGGPGGPGGLPGLSAWALHGGVLRELHGGGGGSTLAPGAGGTGYLDPEHHNGSPGALYPCNPGGGTCGIGGEIRAGYGGEGYYGGGGGGADGTTGFPDFGRGGGGGGGGAGYLLRASPPGLPQFQYASFYVGNSYLPGNFTDPDCQGAGVGGIVGAGTKGRMVISYNPVEMVEELSSSSIDVAADTPIDIVFDSPAELDLDSAMLEVTDPAGDPVAVDDLALQLISAGNLYRYRISWKRSRTGLPAGDYQVTVRVSDHSGVTLTSDPHRVRLVEGSELEGADVLAR